MELGENGASSDILLIFDAERQSIDVLQNGKVSTLKARAAGRFVCSQEATLSSFASLLRLSGFSRGGQVWEWWRQEEFFPS